MEVILSTFGLNPTAGSLLEISSEKACATLETLLWKDMAYRVALMPAERAQILARHFLAAKEIRNMKFFPNANWTSHGISEHPFTWSGLTNATFDGGVIATDGEFAACIWFEDED